MFIESVDEIFFNNSRDGIFQTKLKVGREVEQDLREKELKEVGPRDFPDPQSDEGHETGRFELVSVVSHQGRSADSGHYIAWRRWQHESSCFWLQFDDADVNVVQENQVDLSGGRPDIHSAYLLVYKKLRVKL